METSHDTAELLFWWGVALLAVVTVYWAAVWWWLPKISRGRRPHDEHPKRDTSKR